MFSKKVSDYITPQKVRLAGAIYQKQIPDTTSVELMLSVIADQYIHDTLVRSCMETRLDALSACGIWEEDKKGREKGHFDGIVLI